MKKIFSAFLASQLMLFSLCCGKKGNILPPLVRLPQTAENILVTQKADQIVLTWQNPTAYEDGSTLSAIEKIEIWVLEETAAEEVKLAEISTEEFEKTAKLHVTITEDKIQESAIQEGSSQGRMEYSYDLPEKESLSKMYTFSLRVKDNKRYSPFSELVSLRPMVLPLPPTDVAAEVFQDRIEVRWNPPLKNRDQSSPPNVKGYIIYRSGEEGEAIRLNARLVRGVKYDDRNFVFGQKCGYFIRACATDSAPYLESEDSEAVVILPKDTFAPQPPKGLISVAGKDVLSISWDANTEDDLEGYRVWRREEGAMEFRLLTENPIKESAYNDRVVEKGKWYTYSVTALDKDGNESQKSESVTERVRERTE
jgi:predicted small lipoprotein YifL